MKILILGTGAVASVASKFLSKEKKISQIVCASNNLKLGKEFIAHRLMSLQVKWYKINSVLFTFFI